MTFARLALLAAAIAPSPLIAAPAESRSAPLPVAEIDGSLSAAAS
jgi:hypothetical protein